MDSFGGGGADAQLLDRIKERIAASPSGTTRTAPAAKLPPPAADSEIARAESRLGFELPDLLEGLLTRIANGGFGPGEGILGVSGRGSPDLVTTYERFRGRRLPWPSRLLPVVYAGCDVYFCIDCDHPANRVILFDGDLGGLDESDVGEPRSEWPYPDNPKGVCFRTRADSFEEFLRMWLEDEKKLYRW